jgi:8-oxo-dGTP pyrophosphatase MutT (NUDIX family)
MLDLERLKAGLVADPSFDSYEGIALAAVLVPLLRSDDDWSLVFTRRSDELARHSGEISFPGGRVDDGETAKDAALREAHEELGIEADRVKMLGALPAALTVVSMYQISPWVGIVGGSDFHPNPAEIAEVLVIPLDQLTSPENQREQRFIRGGGIFTNPAYDVGPNTIWGATARILTDFLGLIG